MWKGRSTISLRTLIRETCSLTVLGVSFVLEVVRKWQHAIGVVQLSKIESLILLNTSKFRYDFSTFCAYQITHDGRYIYIYKKNVSSLVQLEYNYFNISCSLKKLYYLKT